MIYSDSPMTIALISDAWYPQVNGVVRTLDKVRLQLIAEGRSVTMITPDQFRSMACPTYPEIRLSINAAWKLPAMLDALQPSAIHIATEGPLGIAARRYCLRKNIAFTTSFHTKFPEYLHHRFRLPINFTYRWLQRFHAPAQNVLATTKSMMGELEAHGFRNCVLWTRGVDMEHFYPAENHASLLDFPRPIWLSVGRVSVEKNLEAFLELDVPGTKIVVGDGPQLTVLRQRYPQVQFVGVKHGAELRHYYAGSDVFVFPSKTDTFGLVMLEALACGTPVAAYPVTGPLDVILDPTAGILHENLHVAAQLALGLSRADCVRYASGYSWAKCAAIFAGSLAPIKPLAL